MRIQNTYIATYNVGSHHSLFASGLACSRRYTACGRLGRMNLKSAIALTFFVAAVLGVTQSRNAADRNNHTTTTTTKDVHPAFERCKDQRIRTLVQLAGQRITPPITVDISLLVSLPQGDCEKAYKSEMINTIYRAGGNLFESVITSSLFQFLVQLTVRNYTTFIAGLAVMAISNGAPVGKFVAVQKSSLSNCQPGDCLTSDVSCNFLQVSSHSYVIA